MSDPDELSESAIRESLQQNIDMSAYESQVYLALIRNGKQSMKEIADASQVPKQRVYDIVEDLREQGFVELDDSYPKKAYAIEPTKTLGPIQQQIEQVQTRLEELHKTVSDIESGVAQFKNHSTIEKYVSELLLSAENTVFLLTSFERLNQFEDELLSLGDVQVRLVISNLDEHTIEDGAISLTHPVESVADHVRGTPRSEPFVLSIDRESGFFWPNAPKTQTQEGFYVTDTELAFLFDRFLSDSIWPLGYPVNIDSEQSSPDLPSRYFRLRDCLADLRVLTRETPMESLQVTFEGYDNVSGEQVTLSGTLSGFYYTDFDEQAYIEIAPDSVDGASGQVVTVGGWKSQHEDYKAHQIDLKQHPDWESDVLDEQTHAHVEPCLSELPAEPSTIGAVVGFDGYIDHIRQLVGERKSPRMYDEIEDFDTVREMFAHASSTEKTLQFEWVESKRLPGGHTAHAGQVLTEIGYDLRLLGYFGQPIQAEFEDAFPDADLLSLGQPTVTEYVQFEDGKFLFTESRKHQALNWETLCEYVPLDDMVSYLEEIDIVSIGGWPLIPEISTIWEGLGQQVYPRLDSPPSDVLVLANEIGRLRETTLRSDLESLSALDNRIPVTVVTTGEQSDNLSDVLLDSSSGQQSLPSRAEALRDVIGVSRLAITASRESTLASADNSFRIRAPRITDPAEEGTFEDHFTAGLALGLAEGVSDASTLVLGSALGGYFKQYQEPPSFEELQRFLETYASREEQPAAR